ncbi:Vacuolar protein sorting-associated protein 13A [Durusdinium trenchii]|uniref:Vacuolar protein sorting-associated protein 13A n=1 Tax=Durusdinium trenchii TaxID=1381693 RepID=A0ABP0IDX1_9DINO
MGQLIKSKTFISIRCRIESDRFGDRFGQQGSMFIFALQWKQAQSFAVAPSAATHHGELGVRYTTLPEGNKFMEEASEMQILQLRQFDKGHYELRFACPNWWLVDRAGLASEQKLEIQYRGRPLPCLNGLTLLPAECLEESCTFVLSAAWKKSVLEVRMPPNFSVLPWPTHVGDLAMVFRPRLVFTNTSDATLQLELDEAPDFQLRFRPESTNECGWSGKVICGDETAGCTSFALATGIVAVPKNKGKMESELWSVAISPARGAMAVTFERGSDARRGKSSEFIAANRSERMHRMEIRTFALEERSKGGPGGASEQISSFTVYKGPGGPWKEVHAQRRMKRKSERGEEVRFGWSSPHENRCNEKEEDHSHCIYVTLYVDGCPPKQIKVPDLRRSDHVYEPELRLQLHWGSTAQGALLSVEDKVKISKAGISIIEEIPPPGAVDCQLPGRTDARSVRKSDATLGGPGQELPAVILANRGLGDRAFLSLQIKRCVSSSGDYLLPFVNIAMDAVDLTLDDGWLDPLQIWSQQLGDERGRAESRARVAAMTERAGKPVLEGYKPPDLPAVIQVDNFYISKVELTVWCALKLRTVRFLPQWIRTAIGMLSFSGHLTLDGVELKLPERRLERHRGSLLDFLRNLGSMYAVNLLSHAAGLLGKSSVLNLPRVPWRITMTTVSYFSDSVGLISGEASSLLNAMAFDEDYVARQRQIRNAKQIEKLALHRTSMNI